MNSIKYYTQHIKSFIKDNSRCINYFIFGMGLRCAGLNIKNLPLILFIFFPKVFMGYFTIEHIFFCNQHNMSLFTIPSSIALNIQY
jgi:hypothetical protein